MSTTAMLGCRWVPVSARARARARQYPHIPMCLNRTRVYADTHRHPEPHAATRRKVPTTVTTLQPPPKNPEPRKPRHDVALWAGAAAFFASLLTIGVFDILNPDQLIEYLGSVLVALITALGVYSKERLNAAKHEHDGRP